MQLTLGSALLLSLLSITGHPTSAAQRPARVEGITVRSGDLPAGLAPVLARTLRNGAGVPGVTWSQQAAITPTDGAAQFGISVAVSGTTALVGASGTNNGTGSAYIFVRSGTTWALQAKLTAADGASPDQFGCSVALSGDTALVGAWGKVENGLGAAGAAYVFVRHGTTWTQQEEWTDPAAATFDQFGYSVSLSGNTALVGALGKNSQTGAAYVFVRHGTTWTQQAVLTAGDGTTGDAFGYSVVLSGGTALIGAPWKNSQTGAAYVFVRSGTSWSQRAKLSASDGAGGDQFGRSVALSGSTALIGAPFAYYGAAYVFVGGGATWTQQAKLSNPSTSTGFFGQSVALSKSTALVGASGYALNLAGAAYVYVRSGTTWTQQAALTAGSGSAYYYFGWSVALSGNTALVGADLDNAAYVFVRSGATAAHDQTMDRRA